jgi:integrase
MPTPQRSKPTNTSPYQVRTTPHKPWSAATIHFLTQSEMKNLLVAIDSKRDSALFLLAYRHVLRASEVGMLRVEDLDLQQYRLRIRGTNSHMYFFCLQRERHASGR